MFKKITSLLYITIAFVVLQSCDLGTKSSTNGQKGEEVSTSSIMYYCTSSVDYYTNNMHYKVFVSAKGAVFVVNITKDSIEINKLNRD